MTQDGSTEPDEPGGQDPGPHGATTPPPPPGDGSAGPPPPPPGAPGTPPPGPPPGGAPPPWPGPPGRPPPPGPPSLGGPGYGRPSAYPPGPYPPGPYPPGPYPPPGYGGPAGPYVDPEAKSKIAAGLLGIFLGGFGVHRFYLGYAGIGVAQIAVTIVTCGVGSLWGFVEGILYLVGASGFTTDAQGRPLRD